MREQLTLECAACKQRNYRTMRNFVPGAPKLELSKYCRFCKKHTAHKERKK